MSAPSNGVCATATVISSLPYAIVVDTTAASTDTEVNPSCGSTGGEKSVWWSITNSGSVDQLLTIDTGGSNYYVDISVWSGACGSLTQVSCQAAAYATHSLYGSAPILAGQTLKIFIADDDAGTGGSLHLAVNLVDATDGLITGCGSIGAFTQNFTVYDPTSGTLEGYDTSLGSSTQAFDREPITGRILSTAGGGSGATSTIREFAPSTGLLASQTFNKPTGNFTTVGLRFSSTGALYVGWAGVAGDQAVQLLNATTYAEIQAWQSFNTGLALHGTTCLLQGIAANGSAGYYTMHGGTGTGQNLIGALTFGSGVAAVWGSYGTWSGGVNPTGDIPDGQAMAVRSDGHVFVVYDHRTSGTIDAWHLVEFDAEGTVLNAFPMNFPGGGVFTTGVCLTSDELSLWVISPGGGYLGKYLLSDGSETIGLSIPDTDNQVGLLTTSMSEPTPPGTTTYQMRRLRRFLLPFDQNYRVFLSRIEILMQTGVGLTTGQGSDPVIMLRLSKDGGFTWGLETQMGIGKLGEYFKRVYLNRLGTGRQWVCEITCTDPVRLAMLDCFVDGEEGSN